MLPIGDCPHGCALRVQKRPNGGIDLVRRQAAAGRLDLRGIKTPDRRLFPLNS
jgi:hypothetical protein